MSTFYDEIGGVSLYNGLNCKYEKNRLNLPFEAIRLRNGHLSVEQKQPLASEFSVTAWVKLNSKKAKMEFLYFSDSNLEDYCIRIDFIDSLIHFKMNYPNIDVKSPILIDSGVWHHLAVVVDYKNVNMYINGLMIAQKDYKSKEKESFIFLKYIGKDNKNDSKNFADLSLDELKIFDGALKSSEVYKQFLKNGIKCLFFIFSQY